MHMLLYSGVLEALEQGTLNAMLAKVRGALCQMAMTLGCSHPGFRV